ncbi:MULTISPECIES: stage VI sporulation protein F [Bacillales]|uniref:Stage VI sporulation protein F n=1 Tax=Lysinibacillus louembei TaxID=1470088 RepID=A0ABZ0RZL2_9BACI|nr:MULTISPECIES: stage VI sporulation protein F [Bacillales]MCT6925879.1 stage VI sporulation protein F [Metasolibacillus sp.]MCT6942087.1 stage VI sporulation protein F [Metasolibacillus sp.]WPK12320.1 stage VI sporulation protein F [Lysinibacillus louembei]
MDKGFFKQFERKTGVEMDEVFALARAIQYADFSNEKQVRKIVQKVSKVAKRKVSPQLEEQIVQSILKDGKSLDLSKIERMMR